VQTLRSARNNFARSNFDPSLIVGGFVSFVFRDPPRARGCLRRVQASPFASLFSISRIITRLYGEDGNDAVNSKDGVSGNDRLDGGAGTDTKVTDTREASVVGFP
jgi:Ca2+-binding RTX toxin-like protein